MAVDETGISNPAGIVFLMQDNNFHVVRANVQGQPTPAYQDIVQLDRFADRSSSARIAAAVEDPINMAFDNNVGRLLSYQTTAQKLIEVKQDSGGELDPASLISHDVRRLGVQVPQGMSVDEASGDLFILDQVGPRIVQIELGSDAGLDTAPISEVDLSAIGTSDLRGLAVGPSTGHFFVVSPNEQRLYELTRAGGVETVRDLSEFGLANPQGMVFAPSGDQTDDPTIMSLFLADSGNPDIPTSGQIVELSMIQPAAAAAASFSSTLVKTTDMSVPPFSPPSPDATGLAYLSSSNTLLVTDSDVEETVGGITHYEGVNVWELTLGGSVVYTTTISTIPPTFVPMTNEPTGTAWNPSNGHYYFTDDKAAEVFDLNPGEDGDLGTDDDSWTSFDVLGIGSTDAEGITFDSADNWLFVVDGVNAEIYRFSLGGNLLGHFDVSQYGVVAPQSVDFNSASGTLFIMEDGGDDLIIETTLNGVLLRAIDYSAIPTIDPGGLAFAPASDGFGANRFYIVDRGVDNNADPNIIDGKMFEITAPPLITPGNLPPTVDAGSNQSITLPTNSVNLNGTVTDDGIPAPVTTLWSQVSGPCSVTFGDADDVDTTATFPYAGRYLLQLDASDSELNSWDTVTVDVNRQSHMKAFDVYVEDSTDDAEEALNGSMIKRDTRLELGEKDSIAQKVGLRFNWLGIPHGATIINATIQFTVNQASSGATTLNIRGQAADNAPTFTGANNNISTRTTTTASVAWTPPAWIAQGDQGSAQRTPNLAPVIQEIVNRTGWVSGNSIAVIITGTGKRAAFGYDGYPCGAAVLHIVYDTPPVAVNNTYTTNEDVALNVAAPGVLANDSDADLDPLTAVQVTGPLNGSLTLNANGSFSYTPNANFNGIDSFTYRANDGTLNSNTATVTITVNPVNDTPVADAGGPYHATVGVPVQFDGRGSSDLDGSIVSYAWNFGDGSTGTGSTPTHTYTSEGDFTVTLTVTDNGGLSDGDQTTANTHNFAPVGNNDAYTVFINETLIVTEQDGVLKNDTDQDLDGLTADEVTGPSNGILTLNGNGSFVYTPDADFYGTDSFTYRVYDGLAYSNTATVTISVKVPVFMPIVTK